MIKHTNPLATICLLLALVVLYPTSANAQKRANPAPAELPTVKFEKYTLPNGLQVILHVDRKLPVVHVNQWFHVGSKNERVGRTGFAHLFEHMMFQGSKNAVGEYFTFVEKAGGDRGVNGTTSNDRTNYFATVPSGNLEYLLWLESDRLATLADVITKEKLDNQRAVVKNERRQSYENRPYGRVWLLLTQLFPAGHPYAHDVIGSHEDLTAASVEDVADFFRTYYTPNNLSIVIAGDFDPPEARRLVEKYFGNIPPGPVLENIARWVPKLDGERVIEAKDRVPQEASYIAWPAPPYFDADEASLDMATSILTDGLSSRLQKALVYEKQLATNVYMFNEAREMAGMLCAVAEARPGASLEQVEQIITDEIARLSKNGPTQEELDRAQTKWEYGYVSGLERIGGFGGKADRLNQYNTYLGNPDMFDKEVARYRGVTVESVRNATSKWLDTRNRLVVRFRPEPSSRETASELDRTASPKLGVDRDYSVPEVQAAKLDNGMQIYVVNRPELPKVAVSLGTRAGSMADPRGKEGLAALTASLIDDGTTTRKALDVSDQLGDLGVYLGAYAEREFSTVTFQALERNVDAALAIVSDIVRNPAFAPAEFTREKNRRLDELAQQETDPGTVTWRVARMLLFGRDHPYGRPSEGLPSTVRGIEASDVAEFHRTWWKPNGSALVFVGAITLDEAVAMSRKHFGSWSGSAPQMQIPQPTPSAPGKIYLIDRQDAAQTMIAQVAPGASRKSNDYYAIRLADGVWGGGGFANRLNLNLREDKGYSYGMYSFPLFSAEGGWWAAGGSVQTDKTTESITEMIAEMRNMSSAKPITAGELERSRDLRLRGFAQDFETLGQVGGNVLEAWSFGLPMSDIGREPAELKRLELDAVNDVARRYLAPEKAFFVMVGDRSKVESKLRDAGAGEIVILDAEGTVVNDARASEPRPVPGKQ